MKVYSFARCKQSNDVIYNIFQWQRIKVIDAVVGEWIHFRHTTFTINFFEMSQTIHNLRQLISTNCQWKWFITHPYSFDFNIFNYNFDAISFFRLLWFLYTTDINSGLCVFLCKSTVGTVSTSIYIWLFYRSFMASLSKLLKCIRWSCNTSPRVCASCGFKNFVCHYSIQCEINQLQHYTSSICAYNVKTIITTTGGKGYTLLRKPYRRHALTIFHITAPIETNKASSIFIKNTKHKTYYITIQKYAPYFAIF